MQMTIEMQSHHPANYYLCELFKRRQEVGFHDGFQTVEHVAHDEDVEDDAAVTAKPLSEHVGRELEIGGRFAVEF